MSLSPSRVAREGLGLPPASGPALKAAAECALCGCSIPAGEPGIRWRPSKSTFTDFQYLTNGGNTVCADCAVFLDNSVLTKTQKCVLGPHGAWKLGKDAHLAWLLTDPPKPPFVAVFSSAMKQHLIWRATPTLDLDLIHIQFGREPLVIDRPLLMEAVEGCREVAEFARKEKIRVTPNHPFVALDRNLVNLSHGEMRRDILALGQKDPRIRERLDFLMNLGPGELWGLSILAKARKENPKKEKI